VQLTVRDFKWPIYLLFFGMLIFPCCNAQKENPPELAEPETSADSPISRFAVTIKSEDLKKHISYLASDELEGRHSGTQGARSAAEYIADHFDTLGLLGQEAESPSHFQRFSMEKRNPTDCYLQSEHGRIDNWNECMEMHGDYYGAMDVDLVFVGYGRNIDYQDIDVQGKLVALFMGRPGIDEIGNDLERKKAADAISRGAVGTLLLVHDEQGILNYIRQLKPYFNKPRFYQYLETKKAAAAVRNIILPLSAAAKLIGIGADTLKSQKQEMLNNRVVPDLFPTKVHMRTTYEVLEKIEGANVLGYIAGSDKADECVVLTAHYDHLGRSGDTIYNGAYDNAAGVAALMEVAGAFMAAAEAGLSPRRSVLFLMPDAEEIGGIGSIFYVSHPLFPPLKTVVDINIDGIGREDAANPHLQDFVHIYLSQNGRSDLRIMRDRAVKALGVNLHLEWRENYAGSDNAFFERELIPAIALGTGQPRDHHQPTDTAEKINYKNVQDIARLGFALAWEIANAEKMIQRIVSK